jgi:hypothetical protein
MLPAVAQALQARHAAIRAAEAAAHATHAAIQALLADGATFQEAAVVLGLSPEEIAEFAPGIQAPAAGGPRVAHGRGDADRPVGPSGLPLRTRSSGPMATHH